MPALEHLGINSFPSLHPRDQFLRRRRRRSIEPDIIVRQEFVRRLAGYLDWDNIYEFSVDQYVSTPEAGMNFALDQKEKWTLSPYVVFPLNRTARISATKIGSAFLLTYNF